MKKTIYVLALSTLFLSACKNNTKHDDDGHKHAKDMPMKNMDNMKNMNNHNGNMKDMDGVKKTALTVKKNVATTPILDGYLSLKNALASDDKSGASKAANTMLKAFDAFDMSKLSEDEHKSYMDIVEDAKEQAEHIAKSPIAHQREHFENLSTDINDLIVLLGTEKTLYKDFCPMAAEGKGAIWLSEFKEIKNPFFGSKMPTCGNVQSQIN
ncbi:MAG: DUF3347 domain-containing protein [Flavobacteriaceae bacterium]